MIKKVCISGYYGFNNFGDEAILSILINNLKKFKNPPIITVFSVTPKITAEKFGVKSIHTFKIPEVIISLLKSDYLISGGGSLLQDLTSIKSLLYYLFVITFALISFKKVIIFAQGIGPIKNSLLKKLTIFLLKHTVFISVRDDNSFKFLIDNSIKNAKKCSDPVWNFSIIKSKNTGKIGIQLRDFPSVTNDFIQKLAKNINRYYSDKEICLLSLQNKIDLTVCSKLKSALLNINPLINIKIIENTSNDNIINSICSLEALIAMRYHACLIAIKAGIKLLPINYDIKVEALAKEFNLNCINFNINIEETFKIFIKDNIKYDRLKIENKKFDFAEIEKIFI